MATTNFLGTPSDFSRLGTVKTAIETGWARIPTYYYDVTQHTFPLTPAQFAGAFGATIKVFNLDQDSASPGRQTNAATGSGINEPFLALGVGVVAIGNGLGFSTTGALYPNSSIINSGDVKNDDLKKANAAPCFDGSIAYSDTESGRNAVIWYGSSTWDFIENFFQAYRLQVLAARRWLLVDEALFDVGMTPTPPEFVGASQSNVPTMPFIREVNAVLQATNVDKTFIPQNTAGEGPVPGETAGVTFGHPRIIGLANRLYCFNQPILMLPGMTFDTKFVGVENDKVFKPSMYRDSVFDPSAGTPSSLITDDLVVCGTVSAAYSTVYTIPGGTVSIGLVFKGYALHPSAVVDYVQNYLSPGSAQLSMMSGNPYLAGLAGQGVRGGNLAGLVTQNGE